MGAPGTAVTERSRPTRRSRGVALRRGRGGLALLAVALCGLGWVPLAAGAPGHASGRTLDPVAQGLAFYKGKTVTEIDMASPGTAPDLLLRAEAQYLAIYLHTTVNVEDIPGGNTIPAQDDIAHANPDGLTLGNINEIGDMALILTHAAGINFNPERLEYIAANGASALTIIASTASPYSSLAAVEHANPPATVLMQNVGSSSVETASILGALHVHVQYILGYSTLTSYLQGFVRGDGAIISTGLGTVAPLIGAGKARALFVTAVPPVGTEGRQYVLGIPTLASMEKAHPAKSKSQAEEYAAVNALFGSSGTVVTQTSVSSFKLAALRAAFAWMFKQPGFKALLLASGNSPTYVNPVLAKEQYITAIKDGGVLVPHFAQF